MNNTDSVTKLIRFSFACSHQVPFYARLCNHYLEQQALPITVAWRNNRFILEAEGNQQQLEALTQNIAKDFLLSLWLTNTSVAAVAKRVGDYTPIEHDDVQIPFCHHCQSRFADSQSPEFGQLTLSCPACNGERHGARAPESDNDLSFGALQGYARQFDELGYVQFAVNGHNYQLSHHPFPARRRQHILVCNPDRLGQHFVTGDHHVLALSSMEKPGVTVPAQAGHDTLEPTLHELSFAWNRPLLVLAEIFRQQGVDYLYVQTDCPRPTVARVNGQWREITTERDADLPGNSVLIYFSAQSAGRLLTFNDRLKSNIFFRLQPLPEHGSEIINQLNIRGRSSLVGRYSERFPEDVAALAQTVFSGERDNITTLLAISAFVLGLSDPELSTGQLADRVLAAGMTYSGKNAQRIDFALDQSSDISSLDFYPTLASLMAYRVATDGSPQQVPALAFGIMDSLADYLATWVEQLDGNLGIEQVTLAGDEMGNELLARRIGLRVGKNFHMGDRLGCQLQL